MGKRPTDASQQQQHVKLQGAWVAITLDLVVHSKPTDWQLRMSMLAFERVSGKSYTSHVINVEVMPNKGMHGKNPFLVSSLSIPAAVCSLDLLCAVLEFVLGTR